MEVMREIQSCGITAAHPQWFENRLLRGGLILAMGALSVKTVLGCIESASSPRWSDLPFFVNCSSQSAVIPQNVRVADDLIFVTLLLMLFLSMAFPSWGPSWPDFTSLYFIFRYLLFLLDFLVFVLMLHYLFGLFFIVYHCGIDTDLQPHFQLSVLVFLLFS